MTVNGIGFSLGGQGWRLYGVEASNRENRGLRQCTWWWWQQRRLHLPVRRDDSAEEKETRKAHFKFNQSVQTLSVWSVGTQCILPSLFPSFSVY